MTTQTEINEIMQTPAALKSQKLRIIRDQIGSILVKSGFTHTAAENLILLFEKMIEEKNDLGKARDRE